MRRRLPLAEVLRIGRPCEQAWEGMVGSDRVRVCQACACEVHDVSQLTRAEATALAARQLAGERVCIQTVVRIADGALLLADGYALRERRAPRGRLAGIAATALTLAACDASPPVERAIPSATTSPAVVETKSVAATSSEAPAVSGPSTPTPPCSSTSATPPRAKAAAAANSSSARAAPPPSPAPPTEHIRLGGKPSPPRDRARSDPWL